MDEPTFDIFMGTFDKDAEWMESVAELSMARQRMEEIAAAVPGRYFVFSQYSHTVLARMDTRTSVVIPFKRKAKSAGLS
jgi:hypothetical protein